MKVEFTLKDRNGIELQEGDCVKWCCEKWPEEKKTAIAGLRYEMWNSGEEIPGKIIFYKTIQQVKKVYRSTEDYKNGSYSFCPSKTASLQLMFVSDKGNPIWAITCPSKSKDFRHPSLEKIL